MLIDRLSLKNSEFIDTSEWPLSIPAVSQILRGGLSFTSPITFFVGDNGSGKSTLLEALAELSKIDVRGGRGGRRYSPAVDDQQLSRYMAISGSLRAKRRAVTSYFLRAETALGVFTFMSDHGVAGYGPRHLAQVSHGESFVQVMQSRMNLPGLYLLDEPEAALSFEACTWLLRHLSALANSGAQIICATHSPILTSAPGAVIYELRSEGIFKREWKELKLVKQWNGFWASHQPF